MRNCHGGVRCKYSNSFGNLYDLMSFVPMIRRATLVSLHAWASRGLLYLRPAAVANPAHQRVILPVVLRRTWYVVAAWARKAISYTMRVLLRCDRYRVKAIPLGRQQSQRRLFAFVNAKISDLPTTVLRKCRRA